MLGKQTLVRLLPVTLALLLMIFIPTTTTNYDDIFLYPKVRWLYVGVLPCAMLIIYHFRAELFTKDLHFPLFLLGGLLGWMILGNFVRGGNQLDWLGAADRRDGILMHALYCLIFLAGWVLSRVPGAVQHVQVVFVWGGLVVATASLSQLLGLTGVPSEGATSGIGANIGGGTLGNSGYTAGILAFLLPFSVALHSTALGKQRVLCWAASYLIVWDIIETMSRGAWVAALLGMGWIVFWKRNALGSSVWLPLCLGLITSLLISPVSGINRQLTGTQWLTNGSGRELLWSASLQGLPEDPWFGLGVPAAFRAISQMSADSVVQKMGIKFPDGSKILSIPTQPWQAPSILIIRKNGTREILYLGINKVHNEFIDYALTYGIPTALIFSIIISLAVWKSRINAPYISSGLLAYGVYLLSWPEIIRTAPLVWLVMGISFGLLRIAREQPIVHKMAP